MKPKQITFRCNCGDAEFLCFNAELFKEDDELWVEVIDEPDDLLIRIKNALKHIFKGGKLYHMELFLRKKDVKRLTKFLEEI